MTGWVPIFDAAGAWPTSPQACWDDGYRAIAGYVNQGSWKSFTSTLKAEWITTATPYGFAPMYEVTGTEAVSDPSSGTAHAKAARKGARALGIPDDVAIAYAVDENVTMTQVEGPIAEYFRLIGQADTCTPIGYIENDGAAWLTAQGLIVGGFIPAAYSWNNPPVLITPTNATASDIWTQEHNGVSLHGGTVDIGHIRTTAPVWWPDGGTDMALTDQDKKDIALAVWTAKNLWPGLLDETALGMLNDLRANMGNLNAATIAKIAAAVVASLPPASGGTPAPVSDADILKIATATVNLFADRLHA